jgi:hypothetical protein
MNTRLLLALFLAGCGASEGRAAGDPPSEPAAPSEEVTAYEIHEWGVIDVDLATRTLEIAAGPGQATAVAAPPSLVPSLPPPVRPGPDIARPRKPVLYFHLLDSNPGFTFDLSVRLAGGGRVVEHWPPGELGEASVRWTRVGLARAHCAGGPYPTAGDPICASVPDGYCEAAELAAYVADDAGCLRAGDRSSGFLFYRGDGPAPALPIAIEGSRGGPLVVTNSSMAEPVGPILRLRRDAGGTITVAQVSMPALGQHVGIDDARAPITDAHREVVREQLRALGLTTGEVAAFERAWFGELFDGGAPTPHALEDALLFFLPTSMVGAHVQLEASPEPAQITRAMALRVGWSSSPQ